MKHLSNLLEKYKKNIKPPQASVEKVCIEEIKNEVGFELEATAVMYIPSTRTLKLKVPSVVKQEIKLKEAAILKKLSTKLGKESCPYVIL